MRLSDCVVRAEPAIGTGGHCLTGGGWKGEASAQTGVEWVGGDEMWSKRRLIGGADDEEEGLMMYCMKWEME